MKEISRIVESNTTSGIACGPVSMIAVVGEIVVEDNGMNKYLTMCWVDEVYDGVSFEITDKSIKEFLLFGPDNRGYFGNRDALAELEEIRKNGMCICVDFDEEYTGDYKEQFYALRELVYNKLVEEDLIWEEDDDEEEDEEDDE